MIRMRKDIDIDIEARRKEIETIIDNSVNSEKWYEERIAFINKELSEIISETCFESTFEGRIRASEDTAFEKINDILDKLSKVTGKGYRSEFLSAISRRFGDCL